MYTTSTSSFLAFVPHRELLQLRFEISHIRRHLHVGEDPLVPLHRDLDHGSSLVCLFYLTMSLSGTENKKGEEESRL